MKKVLPNLFKWLSILFVVATTTYFIGSLSLMTELFSLRTFSVYLDTQTILAYYNKASEFNEVIFRVATLLLVLSLFILLFKFNKRKIGLKIFILILIVVGLNIVLTLYYSIQTNNLLNEFNGLDLSWKASSNPNSYGYREPSNYWIVFTLATTLVSLITSIIYLPVTILHYLKSKKSVGETK